MEHRTYGETKNCKGCRHWSEMIAQSLDGTVAAMCLNPKSSAHSKYTAGWIKCEAWESGYDGAVDEPGSDPLRYQKENTA